MTRKQFINQLSYHLSQLSVEERNEIISFYEDRFNNAIFEGKTEEDIILELETPEDIAKNVLAEYGIQKRVREQKVEPASIIGILFFDLLIASWLIPVLASVSGAIALSWFSFFGTFRVFADYSFGIALASFVIAAAGYAVYLVFIVYFAAVSIKLILMIFTWHVKVFTGNRNTMLIDRLERFSLFEQLAKIKITHKLLGIIAVAGLIVGFAGTSIWRATSKPAESIEGVLEVYEFDVNDLDNYTLSTSLSNAAVDIEYGTTDQVVVRHQNNSDADIKYTELTNGLRIVDNTRNDFWDNVSGMNFFISFLNKDYSFNPDHMTIVIPQGMNFSELEIHTANGKIDIENVEATILDIQTVNGEVTVDEVDAESAKLVTTNGQITVTDLFASTMYVEGVNGEINLVDINTPDNDGTSIDVVLVNGTVDMEDVYFKTVEAATVNGDVNYFNDDKTYVHDRVDLDTVNGDENYDY